MIGKQFLSACLAGCLLIAAAPHVLAERSAQAEPQGHGDQEQVLELEREQQQTRSGNTPNNAGREAKGNQGENTPQDSNPQIREGPYGNKQNAKKKGGAGGK